MNIRVIYILLFLFLVVAACKNEFDIKDPESTIITPPTTAYNLEKPFLFPQFPDQSINPLTEEGVRLGRNLFYEKKLSGDNSLSCAGCHKQENAFSDPRRFSVGIDGIAGTRQSMPLYNLIYHRFFFWDSRSSTLEDQIFEPVPNPIEMHQTWKEAAIKLQADDRYRKMSFEAFGTELIDSNIVSLAISQFLKTLISSNSKFDKYRRGELSLTPSEFRGLDLFLKEGGDPANGNGGQNGADCFHCHGIGGLQFSDYKLHNNGLDSIYRDIGAAKVTGNSSDIGHFKTPSLRNLSFTAPYMHDGRFETLEEVIEHYNSGGHPSETIDPFMKFSEGGLNLSEQDKQDLIAFLKTLDDPEFISDTSFANPFRP